MFLVAEGSGRAARCAALFAARKTRVWRASLFNFFVRRMLAAPAAELLQLQSVRRRFAVLRCRIIPLFAITALHCNDLSGHTKKAPSY
jgi:hypothetical protein